MNSSKEHSNIFSSVLSQSIEDRGFEDYVLKLSNGKCFLNRRYLILRNGILAYYQEKPSDFPGMSGPQQKPKGKIHILDAEIRKVDPAFAKKKNSPHMFQVSFNASGKKKKIFWIFAVNSQSLLNQWLDAFDRSKNPILAINEENEEPSESNDFVKEIEQQEHEEEKIEEKKEKKEKNLREENFKKTLELERQKTEKKQKELEEIRLREEAEKEAKRKEEEKKRRILEKKELKKKEKNKKLLEGFWDYRFQNLISTFLTLEDSEELLETGLNIFRLIGVFKEASKTAAKVIINDLQLPPERRKIQLIGESTYIYKNLIVQLSWEKNSSEDLKVLGHEFRSSDILQDAIFFLTRSDPSFELRVPLTCVIDFKGFRALVTSIIPIDTELTVIHGLKKIDYYLSEPTFYKSLSSLAQVINIKQHSFQWENGIIPMVHLSVFTQIHESLGYSSIEDLENFTEDIKVIYITNLSEILPLDMDFNVPPQQFSNRLRPEYFNDYAVPLSSNSCMNLTQEGIEEDDFEICEASLKVRTEKINEIVEFLDSLTIMPIDSRSMTQALHANGINCRYLGLITYRTALPHIKDLCLVEIIARTCKRLLFQQLADLMLESNSEEGSEFMDESLKNTQKSNVKDLEGNYFLGNRTQSESYYVEELSIQNFSYRKNAFLQRFGTVKKWPSYKELKKKAKEAISPRQNLGMEGSLKECIVDYLNLVFGIGEESDIFWQEILLTKASVNFNIAKEKIDKSQINLHALLHAIVYHCGLSLAFSKETMLGKVENPFSIQSLERIKEKTKVINLKGVEAAVINAKLDSINESEHSLANSLVSLEINKALNPDPDYLGDTMILSEIGEILLEKGDLEGAIKYAKDALLQIHPLHAEGVKSWCILIRAMMENNMQDEALQCFDHALTALEYHWGPYHPLHCTLYSILAYLYLKKNNFSEALILYKNSLMCSLRILGPNHPHTAEIYLELGNLYVQQNSITDAISAFEKGFSVYEASLGKNAIVTVTAGIKLAQLYLEIKQIEKAKELIKNAANVHEKSVWALYENDQQKNLVKVSHHAEKLQEIYEVSKGFKKYTKNNEIENFVAIKIEKIRKEIGKENIH